MLTFADTLRRWWRARVQPSSDIVHAAAVQKTLSTARGLLAAVSLIAVWFDPSDPRRYADIADVLVGGFTLYAGAVLVAAWKWPGAVARRWAPLHVIDLAWFSAITSVTGGVSSPFYAYFIYALLAAGYRWGLIATGATAVFGVGLLLVQAASAAAFSPASAPHLNVLILRAAYLALGAALIGILAENEHKQRATALAIARTMSLVRMEGGLVASVEAVLGEILSRFSAARAVLTLEEHGSERILVWEMVRDAPAGKRRVRPVYFDRSSAQVFLFPVPAGADAWCAERPARGGGADAAETLALDAFGRSVAVRPSIQPLLAASFGWTRVHCLTSISGTGWHGRLFIFDGTASGSVEDELRFLQVVLRQVGPALFNLYLQRRLRSRAGIAERARVARELHDGVIQSLVGLEMQLDVLRRQADGSLPTATRDQLASIQKILSEEVHNVRDLMEVLRPADIAAPRLVGHLAETVERFQRRTGIHARFVCDVDEIALPARTCRELASAIQEALANVRKHSGAANVLVRVALTHAGWQFLVDDDGRGFGFEGTLTHDELDRQRSGPVILKERIRAIGGALTVHSDPGRGSRIEISIPH
jgi:signal transduction histidine kinase